MQGLQRLALALETGELSAQQLAENALERAHQSKSVFVTINPALMRAAYAIDRARKRGQIRSPLAGIPIALKDLFNLKNEKTFAGSVVRKHYAQPETEDAAVVAPLREAGLLFFGRTNMSEFAFSGMGINPHYGTPRSVWDRETGRLPGGSSSGSAVAVAEGVVPAALGSDTAGSCRIPAAFNSIVGVKPSYGRMSLQGVYPLSPSLDAPGPMAVDVESCFILDQLMCGRTSVNADLPKLTPTPVSRIRLAVPDVKLMQDMDSDVAAAFERALSTLREAGIKIQHQVMPAIDACDDFFPTRALVLHEVYQAHQAMLAEHGDEYDPLVARRMLGGRDISEAEQQARHAERNGLIRDFEKQFDALQVDALVYPTVGCIPPTIAATEQEEDAMRINLQCLRHTATVNHYNGCAISLPCHTPGEAPVGFMLCARNGDDEPLYAIASTIEKILNEARGGL